MTLDLQAALPEDLAHRIAATAHVPGATILTTEREFEPLHGLFSQRDWVDPASRL